MSVSASTVSFMPNSKSRTKKSRGKAWRRRRAQPARPIAPAHSRVPAPPVREAPVEIDDWDDGSWDDPWLDDEDDEDDEVFSDAVLGEALGARGWIVMEAGDSSDTWGYRRTREDGRVVVGTSIGVIGAARYVVASYGGDPVVWSGFYDSREQLLADIESIEAHRCPESLSRGR